MQPQYVDLIAMSSDWVEKDLTPLDAPVLSAKQTVPSYTFSANRPICRYPAYSRFIGGDARQAASFRCTIE